MIRKNGGSLVSIIGCDREFSLQRARYHDFYVLLISNFVSPPDQTFSDFPLLVTAPSATKLITKINSMTNSFMHDDLANNVEVKGKEPDKGDCKTKKDAKGRTKLEGEWGDVVVHELS